MRAIIATLTLLIVASQSVRSAGGQLGWTETHIHAKMVTKQLQMMSRSFRQSSMSLHVESEKGAAAAWIIGNVALEMLSDGMVVVVQVKKGRTLSCEAFKVVARGRLAASCQPVYVRPMRRVKKRREICLKLNSTCQPEAVPYRLIWILYKLHSSSLHPTILGDGERLLAEEAMVQ